MGREPTADERAGIEWWNSLTEVERAQALHDAGWRSGGTYTPSAADAWREHKRRPAVGESTDAGRTNRVAIGDLAKMRMRTSKRSEATPKLSSNVPTAAAMGLLKRTNQSG
jgi:hypothetical protein